MQLVIYFRYEIMKLVHGLFAALFLTLCSAKDLRVKSAKPAKIRDYPSIASVSSNNEFLVHGIILNKRVIMANYFRYEVLKCNQLELPFNIPLNFQCFAR